MRNNSTMEDVERTIKRAREIMEFNPYDLAVLCLEIDILDRRGLKNEWNQIDEKIKGDIRETWDILLRKIFEGRIEPFKKSDLIEIRESIYECTFDPCGFNPEETSKEELIGILKNHDAKARHALDIVDKLLIEGRN